MKSNDIEPKLESILGNRLKRSIGSKKIDAYLFKHIVEEGDSIKFKAERQKQYEWSISLIRRAIDNINKGYISKEVTKRLVDVVIKGGFHLDTENIMNAHEQRLKDYKAKYGVEAPSFIVISPTQRCNLHCTNCYASSDSKTTPQLSYETVDKIIGEFRNEMDGRFVVVSGGEPLMYKDGDKTLIDIFRKYNDIFFMFYTNSTLINEEMAQKLAEVGNAVPAISVEGYEAETDGRRGKGVYKKILAATTNLKKVGVPFLISVTATSQNTPLLLSDDFYKFYFDKLGASFMWQFQLMPIGRGKAAFEMMPSPVQRVQLYRKWEELMAKKKYPVADFWNSGVLVGGCIAYGRHGGYVYIDWNGNIMPCVFVPYTINNIKTLYAENKTIGNALQASMMKNGREWQNKTQRDEHKGNLLMPCSIRDHYDNFKKQILSSDAKGEDPVAQEILDDKEYYETLCTYDKKLKKLTDKIWKEEYVKK